jgi:hypothetical protein
MAEIVCFDRSLSRYEIPSTVTGDDLLCSGATSPAQLRYLERGKNPTGK